jgi:hypothetical protein
VGFVSRVSQGRLFFTPNRIKIPRSWGRDTNYLNLIPTPILKCKSLLTLSVRVNTVLFPYSISYSHSFVFALLAKQESRMPENKSQIAKSVVGIWSIERCIGKTVIRHFYRLSNNKIILQSHLSFVDSENHCDASNYGKMLRNVKIRDKRNTLMQEVYE